MPKEKRQEVIKTFRFGESDLKLFEKAASKKDQTLSEWVREALRQAIAE